MIEYILDIQIIILNIINNLFEININNISFFLFLFFFIFVVLSSFFITKLSKKISDNKQKLIYEYDSIFYHIAASQYKIGIKFEDKILQEQHFNIIKHIISQNNPNYISNLDFIKSSTEKLENLLGKQITNKNIWDKINIYDKKVKKLSILSNILKILLIVFFVGIVFLIGYKYHKYF